jgi:hypothetical protein
VRYEEFKVCCLGSLIDRNPAMVERESVREWRFEGDLAIGNGIELAA